MLHPCVFPMNGFEGEVCARTERLQIANEEVRIETCTRVLLDYILPLLIYWLVNPWTDHEGALSSSLGAEERVDFQDTHSRHFKGIAKVKSTEIIAELSTDEEEVEVRIHEKGLVRVSLYYFTIAPFVPADMDFCICSIV
jgi:hypothetical protein